MQKKGSQSRRPGGGWDDSDNEGEKQQGDEHQAIPKQDMNAMAYNINQFQQPIIYLPQQQSSKYQDSPISKLALLSLEDLSNQNCEYEKKIVEDHISPVGVRVKASKSVLDQFLKSCSTLGEQKIGSILLHYINQKCLPQMKAKCLYAIEYLARKNEKYMDFFQANIQIVENCEIENNIIKEAWNEALGALKNQANSNKQLKKVDNMLQNIHEIPTIIQEKNIPKVSQSNNPHQENKKIDLLNDEEEPVIQKQENAFNFIKKNNQEQEKKVQTTQQEKHSNNLLEDFENEVGPPEQKVSQKKNAFEFIKSEKDKQNKQTQKQNAFNFIPKQQENKNKGNNLLDLNFDFDSSPVEMAPPQQQKPQITSTNLLNMYQQPPVQPQLLYQYSNQINQQQPQLKTHQQEFQFQPPFQYNQQKQQQQQQMNYQFQQQPQIQANSFQQQQFLMHQDRKKNEEKQKQVENAFDFLNL